MKRLLYLVWGGLVISSCFGSEGTCSITLPTQEHVEWADAEMGVLIHYDMFVFRPDYNFRKWGSHPDVSVFNPTALDTDQWIRAAKAMGAKYALLTAKHCCGFSLWPTRAHDYNISKTPYKKGKGDIVGEFVASCRKYGVKPGLYASTSANGYLWVDNPGRVQKGSPVTQEQYNKIVETQLTELFTRYGKLFEIWFDGGVLAQEKGGANVLTLLQKYQPNAIVFQGPKRYPHLIRWVGNEQGIAPYPCWSTTGFVTQSGGDVEIKGLNGHPDANLWCPGEADCTLRLYNIPGGGWGWHKGQDHLLHSVPQMMEKYRTSVGRNSNMLIGIVVDDRGLVPEGDVKRMAEFGAAVRARYGTPLKRTEGEGKNLSLSLGAPTEIDRVIIQEKLEYGERILGYEVKGLLADGSWQRLAYGTSVGHKKIDEFKPVKVKAVQLVVKSCKATPKIRNFAVFSK